MIRKNALLLCITLPLSLTAQSMHSSSGTAKDSLETYQTLMWKMWEMVDIGAEWIACDSLAMFQAEEIQKGLNALISSDSLSAIRALQIEALKGTIEESKGLYNTQVGLTGVEKKQKWK